jgi:hypothetical protein
MKRVRSRRVRDPSAASLAELPEIDHDAFVARPNPYAGRIEREGIELAHDGPSAESLAEIPEVAFSPTARTNPYAERLAQALHRVRAGRGRPRAGEGNGPTPARSIRLPIEVWEALEAEAAAKNLTVHAVLRAAVTSYLQERLGVATKKRR